MLTPASHFAAQRSAAIVSMGIGVLMLVGKWAAYLTTGSSAILSDALESVVHVAATAFALLCILLNNRPPDAKYPYGYGKITYFSAGFEGGMIALAAVAILYEAIVGLIRDEPPQHLDLGLILIGIASIVNLALGLWLIRLGRSTDSLVLRADGHHILTDSYTSFGVVVGVTLVWLTGWIWLDGVVAILVGMNILWTGYGLVREAVTGLMDRADPSLLGRIVRALQSGREPGWVDIHNLRAWSSGDRTYVDFHLVVPAAWSVAQVHDATHRCEDLLRMAIGAAVEVIIHFDPDKPGVYGDATWSAAEAVLPPRARRLVKMTQSPQTT